jgi:hypothetical protein
MPPVIVSRSNAHVLVAAAGLLLLSPSLVQAQWWKRAPADFEECADAAEKSNTKQEKTAALAECNAKFAGRRKPGGGYTYYDFLQDRTFDIAGPNPTLEEQKKIDEAYASYLADRRRSQVAEALARQQQQQEQQQEPVRQVVLRSEPAARVPIPHQRPKQLPALSSAKGQPCEKGSFSCDWPKLSDSLNDLKRLFTAPAAPSKAKKS